MCVFVCVCVCVCVFVCVCVCLCACVWRVEGIEKCLNLLNGGVAIVVGLRKG